MRARPKYYKLIGRLPVPMRDIYKYDKRGRLIEITSDPSIQKEFIDAYKNRTIFRTEIGPMYISTIFLVIDHGFDPNAPPLLFETMIFGADEDDSYQERYSTWDEAEKGHAKAVEPARQLLEKANEVLPSLGRSVD